MGEGLPSGLVTFLLTDIEGSTRLFRQLGEGWPDVLDAHNALLRSVFAAHGGVEFKSEGDALLLAFGSAAAAFRAAVDAQGRLREASWPHGAAIRVRMGLHTGIAFPRDGDYVALALHQAARIAGAPNGGQVVASPPAVAAAGSVPGVHNERLGAYRIRDFDEPVDLFQLTSIDDSEQRFPPLRAVPADGHNLQQPGDAIVGRADDLAALAALVAPGQVVTVCGPGGVGKTRLAVELGLAIAPQWPGGAWMVDLSTVPAGQAVGSAVAEALGLARADDALDAIVDHLRDHQVLLILDNCEHVLPAGRELVTRIASACPSSGVLATSRERLGVRAEQVYALQPLVPGDAAVELFIDRARRRDASAAFDEADRLVIAELCAHLDGLPLAIELAAARSSVLSTADLLTRIRGGWSPTGNDTYLADRQRTLVQLLDWSYQLLDPGDQAVFQTLGVFMESFGLDEVRAALGDPQLDELDIAEIVWRLVDKSLVQNDRRNGASRYRLLETVRAAADGYIESAGKAGLVRARLARHYFEAFPYELRGNRASRSRLALEQATIRRLAEELLGDDQYELACALARVGAEHQLAGTSPREGLSELLAFVARVPDTNGLARLHATIAKELTNRAEIMPARQHADIAARLVDRFGADDLLGAVTLSSVKASIATREGAIDALCDAQHDLRLALAASGSDAQRADLLLDLALVGSALDDGSTIPALEEAAVLAERIDDHVGHMFVLNNLAECELRVGAVQSAARHQSEAMRLSAELGNRIVTAFGLVLAARIAQPAGRDDAAVQMHAVADALLEDDGYSLLPDDRRLSDDMLAAARDTLGERFESSYEAGRSLALLDAVELAEDVLRSDQYSPADAVSTT